MMALIVLGSAGGAGGAGEGRSAAAALQHGFYVV
jgi:hypothetical protein